MESRPVRWVRAHPARTVTIGVFGGSGVAMVALGALWLARPVPPARRTAQTTMRVTSVTDRGATYQLFGEFFAHGHTTMFHDNEVPRKYTTGGARLPMPMPGDTVPVWYDPNKVEDAALEPEPTSNPDALAGGFLVVGGVACLLIALGALTLGGALRRAPRPDPAPAGTSPSSLRRSFDVTD